MTASATDRCVGFLPVLLPKFTELPVQRSLKRCKRCQGLSSWRMFLRHRPSSESHSRSVGEGNRSRDGLLFTGMLP